MDKDLAERFQDDFPQVDILATLDPEGRAGVMIITNNSQAKLEGDLGALDWGPATGRMLISKIKTARDFHCRVCLHAPYGSRENHVWSRIGRNSSTKLNR